MTTTGGFISENRTQIPIAAHADAVVVGSVFSASFFGVISALEGYFLKWNVGSGR